MNLDFYFPTPVWWQDTTIDITPVKNLCMSLRNSDPEGRHLSNNGGWQSADFAPNVYTEMREFESVITDISQQAVEDYGYRQGTHFLKLVNMWFNVNGKGNSNQIHTHSGSFLSGVFYVHAVEQHSELVFYRNQSEEYIITSAGYIDRHTAISGATCRYRPRTGRALFFPSWIPHGVLPNEVDEERISIAFNMEMTHNV